MKSDIVDLDEFDLAILDAVAANGRVTVTELARKVGLSKTPCQIRLKRLEEGGIIKGYRAIFDPVRLGLDHIAFVEVKLEDTRNAALTAFNKAVSKIRQVEQCHMIAGSYDYLLKVRTRNITDYRRVLGEKISALPHVAQTSTFVAMEAIKEDML